MKVGATVHDWSVGKTGRVIHVSAGGLQVVFNDLTDVSPAVIKVTYSTVSYNNDAVEKFLEVA